MTGFGIFAALVVSLVSTEALFRIDPPYEVRRIVYDLHSAFVGQPLYEMGIDSLAYEFENSMSKDIMEYKAYRYSAALEAAAAEAAGSRLDYIDKNALLHFIHHLKEVVNDFGYIVEGTGVLPQRREYK